MGQSSAAKIGRAKYRQAALLASGEERDEFVRRRRVSAPTRARYEKLAVDIRQYPESAKMPMTNDKELDLALDSYLTKTYFGGGNDAGRAERFLRDRVGVHRAPDVLAAVPGHHEGVPPRLPRRRAMARRGRRWW